MAWNKFALSVGRIERYQRSAAEVRHARLDAAAAEIECLDNAVEARKQAAG